MQEIDLLDETFVKNQSYHYHLSIQTGLNGLSFCILDLQNLKYIGLRNYTFEGIKNEQEVSDYFLTYFQNDNMLKMRYKSVSHLFIGDSVTLVPSQYFGDDMIQDYYKLNFSDSDHKIILYNAINSGDLYNIFAYPASLYKTLLNCFPQIKMFHQSTSILEFLGKETLLSNKPTCYLYFYKNQISIGLVDNKRIQYFNVFKIQHTTDIIYYILSVLDQYKCNTKNTDIYVSSDIESHDEVFEELNKFFTQFKFISPSGQFTYSYLFDELYLTRYANLFNLVLCE